MTDTKTGDAEKASSQAEEPSTKGEGRRRSTDRVILWIALFGLLAALLAGWVMTAERPLFGLLESEREGDASGGGNGGGGGSQGRGSGGPVSVATVVLQPRLVPVYNDYTGTTEAVRSVVIRPRVGGYLTERAFEEGELVEPGDLLYRIDERPFRNALNAALALRDLREAEVALAEAQVARLEPLADRDFASQADLDEAQSQLAQAQANVRRSNTDIEGARLNLEFATIQAPFGGRIGFSQAEVGDLVAEGDALTDLVTLDPIFVTFRPSERELPAIERARRQSQEPLKVEVTLSDGTPMEAVAALAQIENEVAEFTGTIAARAVLPNDEAGLLPGQFVRARLILRQEEGLLVPTDALVTDQGRRVVYLFDEGTARVRPVVTGRIYGEQTRILDGLSVDDEVITSNLQRVRPGVTVQRAQEGDAQTGERTDGGDGPGSTTQGQSGGQGGAGQEQASAQ